MAKSFNLKVTGIDDVIKRLGRHIGADALSDVSKTTETYARKMANESADMAPIKDGALRNSIASSPEQIDTYTWQYGSDLPYALRQEYEHKTNKAFIRKSVWNNREAYRKAVKNRLINGR